MTCQHCQTWVLDEDHRCRRCGRRVRSLPSRISPNTYPIAATATAPAYDFEPEPEPVGPPVLSKTGQQALFTAPATETRVIPFESLTTQTERESIRARAADLSRPAPLKAAKVEVRRPRARKNGSADQRRLEFLGQEEVLQAPQSSIICNAPVAPVALRVEAALLDTLYIALGCLFMAGLFKYVGGPFSLDKHTLPFLVLALLTVPLWYKLLWTCVNLDTPGTRAAGLRVVDFDGNPPSQLRRYQRFAGGLLSLTAACVGLIWSLVDEDSLTWHDYISNTFPTLASEPTPETEASLN